MECNNCNKSTCCCSSNGLGQGAIIVDGNFTYQAWASNRNGLNFSLTPIDSNGVRFQFTAIIISNTVIDRLEKAMFADKWFPISGNLSAGDNVSELVNDVPYLKPLDNVSELENDAGYVTNALQQGDNVSELENDAGYITTQNGSSEIIDALGYVPENSADKGQPNGYASLGSNGKVPNDQLPAINFNGQIFIYDTEQEMFDSINHVIGDLAILENPVGESKSYLYAEQSTWLPVASFNVSSVNGQTGAITGIATIEQILFSRVGDKSIVSLLPETFNNVNGTYCFVVGSQNILRADSLHTILFGSNHGAGLGEGNYNFIQGRSHQFKGDYISIFGNNNYSTSDLCFIAGEHIKTLSGIKHMFVSGAGYQDVSTPGQETEPRWLEARADGVFIHCYRGSASDWNLPNNDQLQFECYVSGSWSALLGGMNSIITGKRSVVIGGYNHNISGDQSSVLSGKNIVADRDNTAYTEDFMVTGNYTLSEGLLPNDSNTLNNREQFDVDLLRTNLYYCDIAKSTQLLASPVIMNFTTKPYTSTTFTIDVQNVGGLEKPLSYTTTTDMIIKYSSDLIETGSNATTEIWGRYSKARNTLYLSTNGGFITA